jgi:hydroxyacylglutathione hydrolase
MVFVGDTLFAMGCGRLFEGTAETMWISLDRLRRLPPETTVYCGHDYDAANARFALTVDPGNAGLQARAAKAAANARAGTPAAGSAMGTERATNPFLRADEAVIAAAVGLPGGAPAEVFAELRRRKDHFA